ncbi:MAG: hypothetical protein R2737_04515 [Candidatus Nanopelagicales bacterium]
MPVPLPDATTRWRCSHCGNLTRFDVVRVRRTREFWHVALSGEAEVEQEEVLDEVVEDVRCRWCSTGDSVVLVPRPEAGGPTEEVGLGGTP